MLTLIRRTGARALYRCACGVEKEIRVSHVKSGAIRSCGCISRALAAVRCSERKTHGHASGSKTSPTYRSYRSMRQRCEDATHEAYADYGGRGIAVCERWQTFENFLADMGERPAGLTLDRRNNDLGYEPGNCHWATRSQQNRNRRSANEVAIARAGRAA